ncbi:hypothetical protein GS458_2825 [Geobacillus stearothermophilus]|nr:hypothetical protein GS458_2825 [Geobacillus stearothermophilus]
MACCSVDTHKSLEAPTSKRSVGGGSFTGKAGALQDEAVLQQPAGGFRPKLAVCCPSPARLAMEEKSCRHDRVQSGKCCFSRRSGIVGLAGMAVLPGFLGVGKGSQNALSQAAPFAIASSFVAEFSIGRNRRCSSAFVRKHAAKIVGIESVCKRGPRLDFPRPFR